MSKGRKRIVCALIAVMTILIAVATSNIFIGNTVNNVTISSIASAETTANVTPTYGSEDIMPMALTAGDNYEHVNDEISHGYWDDVQGDTWEYLTESDYFGKIDHRTRVYLAHEEIKFSDEIHITGNSFALCLNGNTLIIEANFNIDRGGNFHICDCTGAGVIRSDNGASIVVEGGASLVIDSCEIETSIPVEVNGGSLTVCGDTHIGDIIGSGEITIIDSATVDNIEVQGGTLTVGGNPTIGRVTLSEDSIIECKELTNDADIRIEADSDRKGPYIDVDSFNENNSGTDADVTKYFTMSDGSDPFAIKVGIASELLTDVYNGKNRYDEIKEELLIVEKLSTGEALTYDDDYTIKITKAGEETEEVINVGSYDIEVILNEGLHYEFVDADRNQSEYSITKDSLNVTVSGDPVRYDGEEHAPTITVTGENSGVTLTESDSDGYIITYDGRQTGDTDKPMGAGIYSISVTLCGDAETNYETPYVDETFEINQATITLKGAYTDSKTYDKNVYSDEVTVAADSVSEITVSTDNGLSEEVTVHIQTDEATAKTYDNKTDFSISYSDYDKENYTIVDDVNYTVVINKATITVNGKYTAEKAYDGEGFTVSGDTVKAALIKYFPAGVEDPSLTVKDISTAAAAATYNGTTNITNYDSTNFELDSTGDIISYTITITKAKIKFDKSEVSITASKEYDGNTSVTGVKSDGENITIKTGVKSEEVTGYIYCDI